MYGLNRHDPQSLDKEKAESIFRMGLDVELDEGEEGRNEILERINELDEIGNYLF